MTLAEIREQIMFQTNNDADDLGDFLPHLDDYINDGYDQIVNVWDKRHVPCEAYPRLAGGTDEPVLPEWMHRYIADWATWLVYRNGNPQKQQRGNAFRQSFLTFLSQIADEGGKDGLNDDGTRKQYKNFRNIPV
jgi:hypothetical protein